MSNNTKAQRITAGCLALTNSQTYPVDNGMIVRVESRAPTSEFDLDDDTYEAAKWSRWVVRSLGRPFVGVEFSRLERTVYAEAALIPLGTEGVDEIKSRADGRQRRGSRTLKMVARHD